jgi:FtsH-binding integral membrane protein
MKFALADLIGVRKGRFHIFLIRLVLALVLAFFISRIFFRSASIPRVIALAAGMFFLAYLLEYTKRKDRGGIDGNQ